MKTNLAWVRDLTRALPDELPDGLNVELTLKVATKPSSGLGAIPRWAKIVAVGLAAKLSMVLLGAIGLWAVHLIGWL